MEMWLERNPEIPSLKSDFTILPPLPYLKTYLEPFISAKTLEFHHDKHHAAYVNKLNMLVSKDSTLKDKTLNQLITDLPAPGAVFNNAAQHYNHDFYWKCMTSAEKSGKPAGKLLELINQKWKTFDAFANEFKSHGSNHFGSGWIWLVQKSDSSLDIVDGHDAMTPLRDGLTPLLCMDVWEHAYYLDTQNSRPKYIENFFDHIVNWEFVSLFDFL